MNNLDLVFIELILVGALIVFQTERGISAYVKIKYFRSIIPKSYIFKLRRFYIPHDDLRSNSHIDLMANLSNYEKRPEGKSEIVNVINPGDRFNPILDEILDSINVYLLRNKGAATDFNLIKDIVERNLDLKDEEISNTTSIPLYLGLMGTMVGIVFGLFNLLLLADPDTPMDPKGFLGGVSIAMFASFYGLGWTVFNSSHKFNDARSIVEKSKNRFYTSIQTELLPILNQSISSSVHALHYNLSLFNTNFTTNLETLKGLLNKNHDALLAQESILQVLEDIDIAEFAKANVKVLKELKEGTDQLQKFSQYITSINYLVNGTQQLANSFETMFTKMNHFQGLAEKLDSRVEESNKLIEFINSHFRQLDDRGKLIVDSVVKVEDVMIKSLGQLEDHTYLKIEAIKQITIKEEDLMTKAFAENSSHFSKLHLLVDLKDSIEAIRTNSLNQMNQIDSIKVELKVLNNKTEKTNDILGLMNSSRFYFRMQHLFRNIKNLFAGKK